MMEPPAVLVVLLTRGGVKAYRGRYKPTITRDLTLPGGASSTNKYDLQYSPAGSTEELALVLYHEKVHSFVSPKRMKFREQRANMGMVAYEKSAFLRGV